MKKRYWIILIIIAIVAGLIIFKKGKDDSYTAYTVIRQDVSDELLLAGTIDAQKRVDLGFASSGRIKKINFETGDIVKKGDVIAEIEQNRLGADLKQAQANLNLTRANTSTDLDSAKISYETVKIEQDAIVEGLYQEYLSGDLRAYNLDENPRDRQAPVVSGSYLGDIEGEYILDLYSSSSESGHSFKLSGLEKGTYTAQEFQPGVLGSNGLYIQFDENSSYSNTEWVVPVPNIRSTTYISRKRAYENSLVTRTRILSDAQNSLNRVSGIDENSNTSIEEAKRAQARAQVNAVAAQLGDGKIRAPFDGVVAKHELEEGEIISAFTPLVVMFANQTKELKLNTPEIYINKIDVGDLVNINLDAYPDEEFIGRVEFIDVIDTEVDGVPVYKTEIILEGEDPRIRIGMNAKAKIIADKKESVIAIPVHYIQGEEEKFVNIRTSETPLKYEKRIIQTGFKGNNGLIEITSGLAENDIILIDSK